MACRRVVTVRQMRAAHLMVVEGLSAYRALCQVGYARSTARNFGKLLRGSWGLREALRLALAESGRYLVSRPMRRRKKHDRRPLALNVNQYVGTDLQALHGNTFLHRLHAETKRCNDIAQEQPRIPTRCSFTRFRCCKRCLRYRRAPRLCILGTDRGILGRPFGPFSFLKETGEGIVFAHRVLTPSPLCELSSKAGENQHLKPPPLLPCTLSAPSSGRATQRSLYVLRRVTNRSSRAMLRVCGLW
jgi:hypothetical protein